MMRGTLQQMRIFDAAGRHLHFGRAAAEMNLTQPAISLQLRQFEEHVGLPLFEQIGRKMHLTAAGNVLLGHVRSVLQQVREADDAVQKLIGSGGGELHIAATTTTEYFVPRLIAAFRLGNHAARIRLTVDNRDAVVRALSDNTVDLAIMGRAPANLEAQAQAFARHPLALIASPDHPLVARRKLKLHQLAQETFLIRERGSGTRGAMERAFADAEFQPAETMEFGSNEAIKQAVMAGIGIGFVSLHTTGLELTTKRLTVLRVAGMPVMRDWYVIHLHGKRLSAAASAFKAGLISGGAALIEKALRA
ncbi:MAG: LysR family transcriptional regulator, partial [Pseudorhodoplanes sp.]